MGLAPLGHRVLVKPDVKSNISDSGLILPEDRDHVPVSGQVVALGPGGSLVKFKARQRALTEAAMAIRAKYGEADGDHSMGLWMAYEMVECMRSLFDPHHDIAIGDFVAFPADVGFKVTHGGEEYVLVNEDDIAVLETA